MRKFLQITESDPAKSDVVGDGHYYFAVRGENAPMSTARHNDGPVDFGPPFDDDDADIILRSSNNVDFAVRRVCLSKASPVFKAMFSPQQRPSISLSIIAIPTFVLRPSGTKRGLPVLTLTEPGPILEGLLSLTLPVSPVQPTSVEEARQVVAAAHKYQMKIVLLRARAILQTFLTVDTCLDIFVLAHRLGLREEMIKAARLSLPLPLSLEDHASDPGLSALQDLTRFRQAYGSAASKTISSPKFFEAPALTVWLSQHNCEAPDYHGTCSNTDRAWMWIISSVLQKRAQEVSQFPERLHTLQFSQYVANGPGRSLSFCYGSSPCLVMRYKEDYKYIDAELSQLIVQIVNEAVLDKVS